MSDFTRLRSAAFAFVVLLVARQAWADAPAPGTIQEQCVPAVENKSCYVLYESGRTPAMPALRVNSDKDTYVEIRVGRNPFDKVVFDESTVLQLEPDIGWAILKQLLDPLKLLVLRARPEFVPLEDACEPRDQDLCDIISAALAQQEGFAARLNRWEEEVSNLEIALDSLKRSQWATPDAYVVDETIKSGIATLLARLGAESQGQQCGMSDMYLARCEFPIREIAVLNARLEFARVVFAGRPPIDSELYRSMSSSLVRAAGDQVRLEDALALAREAQAKLVTISDKLKSINLTADLTPKAVHLLQSPAATAQTQVKIAANNVWSGKTSNLPGVTVNWQDMRWELSAGVMFSSLPKRSFSVAPQLDTNGVPMLDATGKAINVISSTKTTPTVVPVALVHYRFTDEKAAGTRRKAWLATAGLGVNDGSAEGFAGVSYARGGFLVTGGLHVGRLKQLQEPLEAGMTTAIASGDIGKFEEKKWEQRFGIAVSYRVPLM